LPDGNDNRYTFLLTAKFLFQSKKISLTRCAREGEKEGLSQMHFQDA
jgi:hypothetical protein